MSFVIASDEQSPRSSINNSKFLASKSDSRCVDNRHHLLDVLTQEPEEQTFVPLLFVGTIF